MNRFVILLIFLSSASLACALQVAPPVMTALPTETDMPPAVMTKTTAPVWTAQVSRPMIYVRNAPDGDVIGNLQSGDTVTIESCEKNWCRISKPVIGYIFKGCLTIESNLGCTMKEE